MCHTAGSNWQYRVQKLSLMVAPLHMKGLRHKHASENSRKSRKLQERISLTYIHTHSGAAGGGQAAIPAALPQLCPNKRSPGWQTQPRSPRPCPPAASADQPGPGLAAACPLKDERAQTTPRYNMGSKSFQALGKKCWLVSREATWAKDELRARSILQV